MKAERAHLDFQRAGTIMCLLAEKVRQAPHFVNGNVSLVNKLHNLQAASPHLQNAAEQRGTARHGTAQHSTARHSTARHSTARHGTAQHSTAHSPSSDQPSVPSALLSQCQTPPLLHYADYEWGMCHDQSHHQHSTHRGQTCAV